MNRLDNLQKPILACYLPLGDPLAPSDQAGIYAEQGVDLFEVGVPCRDPFLDGEIVRNSMARTLAAGVGKTDILQTCFSLRTRCPDQAIVLMGYGELLSGRERTEAAEYCDGLLEIGPSTHVVAGDERRPVHAISFVPNHLPERCVAEAVDAKGYIMLQACSGETGLRKDFDTGNVQRIERLRRAGVTRPILLGVGISNAKHARLAIECGADGVVIGSACLAKMQEGAAALRRFLQEVRESLNGAH